MVTPLNLYATKVFSEQPLALWALDDQVDYISLISDAEQDLSTWTSTGVDSVVDATDDTVFTIVPPSLPFVNEPANGVIGSADNNGLVAFTSPLQYQPSDFSDQIQTFSIGTYVYSYAKIIDLRLGYRYTDPSDSQTYEVIKAATTSSTLAWASVSESFALPSSFTNLELIVEVYYLNEGAPYEFVLNGLTAGQWAEEFHLESRGINSGIIDLSSTNIANVDTTQQGVKAFSYGLPGNDGYYIIKNNTLLAKNNAMPLVYGSRNSTKVIPNVADTPSMIVPGFGFMNKLGENNELTAEFWIKITSDAVQPRKIFGPLSSADGLYVDGPFIKLKIGSQVAAHPIREWDRPMLLDIRLSSTQADLVVNGAQVLTINREVESYSFSSSVNAAGQSQDWLGFYAYVDVPILNIDCVAVYPYFVSNLIAKRRWVYGQAVDLPTDIKGLDSLNSVSIDYSFSNYAKNYSFPNNSGWSNGVIENLRPEEGSLNLPNHPMPTVKLNNKSNEEWLSLLETANTDLTDPLITLRPDLFVNEINPDTENLWSDAEGYLFYPNMNFLSEQTKAFYGIFETTVDYAEKQTLFQVTNQVNSNYVEIYLKQETFNGETESNIFYTFNFKNPDGTMTEEVFYKSRGQKVGDRFLVGIDVDRFVQDRGDKIANFFGTRQRLTLYIGGKPSFSNTYKGMIRRIAFCNSRNLNKIKHFFTEYGVPVDYENVFNIFGQESYDAGAVYFGNDESFWSLVLDGGTPYDFVTIGTEEHVATYTLIPKNYLNRFYLDINVNSYWEDYLPLSYFAKTLIDGKGNARKYLNWIQFNIDYPALNNFSGDFYNNNGAVVKSFVSFQYLQSGSNSVSYSFTKTELLNKNKIVRPGSDWLTTKYEVVNGSVIYPPQNIPIDQLSINVHLEFEVEGVSTNPMQIRQLQLSSQALNDLPTYIGTKFGNNLVPFAREGSYFNYRNVTPPEIYKGSSPYFYQTAHSGIKLLGNYTNAFNSGLSTVINKNTAEFFKLGSMQMFLRFDEKEIPTVPVKIFEINYALGKIDFFLVADSTSRQRGQIYAVDLENNRLFSNIVFFTNGKPTKRGIIYPRSWTVIGLSFPDFLDFGSTRGSLRLTSPIRFDNLTLYETSLADDEERFGFRQWFSVRNTLGTDLDWGYWAGKELVGEEVVPIPGEGFTWKEVLFLSAILREELDGANIYNIYTGTSRIIAQSDNDLTVKDYQYNIFSGLRWSQNIVTAV